VISVEVRDRYSPDEGGDYDMGVKGSILEELDGDDCMEDDEGEEDMGVKGSILEELDGDDCMEDDEGEEDMGVDERVGGCWINGSDFIKLKPSE
jgi:hypothetical protein